MSDVAWAHLICSNNDAIAIKTHFCLILHSFSCAEGESAINKTARSPDDLRNRNGLDLRFLRICEESLWLFPWVMNFSSGASFLNHLRMDLGVITRSASAFWVSLKKLPVILQVFIGQNLWRVKDPLQVFTRKLGVVKGDLRMLAKSNVKKTGPCWSLVLGRLTSWVFVFGCQLGSSATRQGSLFGRTQTCRKRKRCHLLCCVTYLSEKLRCGQIQGDL